ncbi:uncharacterized protein LOC129248432 [Anastrepha obliqua]|uniref:uncharacterized protein LOC129248432 n=1 Tax=Anastrepha obliqua TaxID=95512 RepID=UPI0024099A90|nr:uncharacterized protein LOC129248432 [Anastrepha obliqua]XP_054743949.1 uncharacterized protein LOC129248432 [Anastrepha obliqua]
MAATMASVTAAPFVTQNSLLSLTQQTLQKHFHNGNTNNNHHYSISDNISTFISASSHNYNRRHSQLPLATLTPPTSPPATLRIMDIEVLNASSSSSSSSSNNNIIGGDNANHLKSLSSIVEASDMGEGYMNQLPIFDFGLPRNITARTGQTEATIKCRVERLDDKSVSWIRKRDLHILTVATATYTSDKRFQVSSSKDGREWILHVKSPQARDSGIYECQVNTEPKMSMAFQLNIIEIPADSRAVISGPADLHFKVGSAIILNCHVQQPSSRDIGPIYWYRGDHIITPFEVDNDESDSVASGNTDSGVGNDAGAPALADNEVEGDVTATITNANALAAAGNASPGRETNAAAATQHDDLTNEITPDFTARIAMESQLGDTMKSRLRISNAQTTDTGNYTCQPTTASSASVMVHVINDENPAAMQKSSAGSLCTTTTTIIATKYRTNMMLMLLVATIILKTLMTRANLITRTIADTPMMRANCEVCRWQCKKEAVNGHQKQQAKQQNNRYQHQQ